MGRYLQPLLEVFFGASSAAGTQRPTQRDGEITTQSAQPVSTPGLDSMLVLAF